MASILFPKDGVKNGPLGGTGRTATVTNASGDAVGYAYFYEFDGGYNLDDYAVASMFDLLVKGRADLTDPTSELVEGHLEFGADELKRGATKSTIVGALWFDVTIEHVDIVPLDGDNYFNMSTISARVEARSVDGSTP